MQSTTFHVLHTPPHRALRLWLADSLRALAQRAWLAFEQGQRRRAERATLRCLERLDSHVLRDLGLDRSELMSVSTNPGDSSRMRHVAR